MIVVVIVAIMIVVVVFILVADQLVGSSSGIIADLSGTRDFEIVKTFFGKSRQDIMVASVVGDTKQEEQVSASVGRTVDVAAGFDEAGVGVVSASVLTVGNRTGGGTLDERSCNTTEGTDLIKVVERIFDGLGNAFFRAVIVVGLDNIEVLLALFGRAVSSTCVSVQEGKSIKHSVSVSTINGETEFFGLACTRASGCRSIAEKSEKKEKGR